MGADGSCIEISRRSFGLEKHMKWYHIRWLCFVFVFFVFLRQTSFKHRIKFNLGVTLQRYIYIYITLFGSNYKSWKQFAHRHGKTSSLSIIVSSNVLANKLRGSSGWNRWTLWNSELYFNSTENLKFIPHYWHNIEIFIIVNFPRSNHRNSISVIIIANSLLDNKSTNRDQIDLSFTL